MKGVDAIIEEYKRKWDERENKRLRYNQAAASQGGGRRARRGPGRPPVRTQVHGQRNMSQYLRNMQQQT